MGDVASLLSQLRLDEEEGEHTQTPLGGTSGRGLSIGGQTFANLNSAWEHISSVKKQLLGQYIGPDHTDFDFLAGLLARHPRGPAKVEHPPVRQFTAQRNVSGRGIEFRFVDSAGKEHDFSAKKCMERQDVPAAVKLAGAMAVAVIDQKQRFKKSAPQQCHLCSATGCPLVVDHSDPPMPQLRHDFMQAWGKEQVPTLFAEAAHGGAQFRPEDRDFEAAWQEHHRQRATLRLLCEGCLMRENQRRGISTRFPGRSRRASGGSRGRGRGRGGRAGRGIAWT